MTTTIASLAINLAAKVQSIPSLVNAKFTVGGRRDDPGLQKIPLPAAWMMLASDHRDEEPRNYTPNSAVVSAQPMLAIFAVVVFVPYTDDDDLLNVELPLLASVTAAIHAQPADDEGVNKWCYLGQKKALVYPDRLAYEQLYMANYWTQAT